MQVVDCRYPIIWNDQLLPILEVYTYGSWCGRRTTHRWGPWLGTVRFWWVPDLLMLRIWSKPSQESTGLYNRMKDLWRPVLMFICLSKKHYMLYMYRAFVWLTAMSAWHSLAQCHPSSPEHPLICKAFCWKGMRNSCQEMRSLSSSSIRVGTAKWVQCSNPSLFVWLNLILWPCNRAVLIPQMNQLILGCQQLPNSVVPSTYNINSSNYVSTLNLRYFQYRLVQQTLAHCEDLVDIWYKCVLYIYILYIQYM